MDLIPKCALHLWPSHRGDSRHWFVLPAKPSLLAWDTRPGLPGRAFRAWLGAFGMLFERVLLWPARAGSPAVGCNFQKSRIGSPTFTKGIASSSDAIIRI